MNTSNNLIAQNKEVFYLKWSVVASLSIGLVGIFLAIQSRSITVFIDSSSALLDAVIYYITVLVANKLNAPPNKQFNFGFFKFEPMLLNVEALATIVICVSGLIASVGTFFHPEHADFFSPKLALFYTAFSFAWCLFITSALYATYKKHKTELLKANTVYWAFDLLSSALLSIGFILCVVLNKVPAIAPYTHYVDPLLAIAISLMLIKQSAVIFYSSLKDLLDSVGEKSEMEEVEQNLTAFMAQYKIVSFIDHRLYSRKAGRMLIVYILYSATADTTVEQLKTFKLNFKNQLPPHLAYIDFLFIPTTHGKTELNLFERENASQASLTTQ